MYYGLIALSVVMFGANFMLNDMYRRERPGEIKVTLEFSLIGSIAGLIVLIVINGISLRITPFAALMGVLSAANGFAFAFFTFKALKVANLSLYSVFSMLGGMLLPFLQGIIFYGEDMTLAKVVCLLLIFAALALTVERGSTDKRAVVYYALIFLLNGMSGVLSKIFASSPVEWRTTASGAVAESGDYSLISVIATAVISALLLIIFFRKSDEGGKHTPKSIVIGAAYGSVNKVANWILVLALSHGIDSSVQYPMVTGGVMIVSTAAAYILGQKPSKRELLSVGLAFLSMLALFLIPIIIKIQ